MEAFVGAVRLGWVGWVGQGQAVKDETRNGSLGAVRWGEVGHGEPRSGLDRFGSRGMFRFG